MRAKCADQRVTDADRHERQLQHAWMMSFHFGTSSDEVNSIDEAIARLSKNIKANFDDVSE